MRIYRIAEFGWIEESRVFLSILVLLYVHHTEVDAAC